VASADRLAWREHVEAELGSLRGVLARLETTIAEDRGALRAASGQWAAVQAASSQWPEQIGQLRAQVERLDQRMRDDRVQIRDELDGLQDDIGRLGGYTLQTAVQERMINRVEEDQVRLAETLTAVSQGLIGERVRTNTVIMAGAAVALVSTTAVLLANAPRFW
jgi:chromosome segregation ATPase